VRVMPPAGEETRCLTVMDRNPASRCLGPKPATAITRRRRKSRAEWQPREAGEVTASQTRRESDVLRAERVRPALHVPTWWPRGGVKRTRPEAVGPINRTLTLGLGF
jgi:hypothetical protein